MRHDGIYSRLFKRLIDILLSLIAIVVLSPILLIVAFLIKFKLGSPILFKQARPGLNGEIFNILKFRTMTDQLDEEGNLLPDDQRLTKFGQLLRSTSIDELPELINIIKGDMSIVGPRPLLVAYLPLYNEEQAMRHLVRPGLTGYAQVNGRNALSWTEKFELDVHYINNISFLLDLKIVIQTIKKVLIRDGISADGHVTIEPFKGNENDE